MVNQPSK